MQYTTITAGVRAVCILAALFQAIFPAPAYAGEVQFEEHGYYMDIPEGWQLLDAADTAAVSFGDPSRRAVFQIFTFPAGHFASAGEAAEDMRRKLAARGDQAGFLYENREAVLADWTFSAGKRPARGWFVFLDGESRDFALLAFVPEAEFASYNDLLLSCLDSFAPREEALRRPGPVSVFYLPHPAANLRPRRVDFGGESLTVLSGEGEPDANQTVIEREARILAGVKEGFVPAWKRFFRIIHRDTFSRLRPLAGALEPLIRDGTPRDRVPAVLLAWFQEFSYARTGTLSDFQSPLSCVLTRSGDCDSLGMAYVILLEHWGYDAILLVSAEYSHAMAGVDVPGDGARYIHDGKGYLTAELTDRVGMGLVGAKVADPAKWIPVPFGRPVDP